MQHDAIHVNHLKVLHTAIQLYQFDGLLHVFLGGLPELVVTQTIGQRVKVEAARHFLLVEIIGFHVVDETFHQIQIALHVVELHTVDVQVNIFQQRGQSRIAVNIGGVEGDTGGTAFQGIHGNGVRLGRIGLLNFLNDIPVVVTGFRATRVRKLVRHSLQVIQILKIFSAIIRTDLETFVSSPDQFLLVIGAFKVFIDGSFPLFRGHGREFGE